MRSKAKMFSNLIYRTHGVGFGNLLQFAHCANVLGYENTYCNDSIYFTLGIAQQWHGEPVERIYLPMRANWKGVLEAWKLRPKEIIGFEYRIKGRNVGFGLTRVLKWDQEISEQQNYFRNFDHRKFTYDLGKTGKLTAIWNKRDHRGASQLNGNEFAGSDFLHFPEDKIMAYSELLKRVKQCNFFIGTDGGLLHLFHLLGIPGIVIWSHDRPRQGFLKNMPPGITAVSKHTKLKELMKIYERNKSV